MVSIEANHTIVGEAHAGIVARDVEALGLAEVAGASQFAAVTAGIALTDVSLVGCEHKVFLHAQVVGGREASIVVLVEGYLSTACGRQHLYYWTAVAADAGVFVELHLHGAADLRTLGKGFVVCRSTNIHARSCLVLNEELLRPACTSDDVTQVANRPREVERGSWIGQGLLHLDVGWHEVGARHYFHGDFAILLCRGHVVTFTVTKDDAIV